MKHLGKVYYDFFCYKTQCEAFKKGILYYDFFLKKNFLNHLGMEYYDFFSLKKHSVKHLGMVFEDSQAGPGDYILPF